MIKNKFIGKIELMKNMNIKPNFSELARQYGVDRHTIAKYYHQEKRIPVKRNKESYLYPYLDEIKQKADLCRCTKKALFQYFQNKYGVEEFKCYNTFTYLPGNMISALLIILKNQNCVMRLNREISFRWIGKNR